MTPGDPPSENVATLTIVTVETPSLGDRSYLVHDGTLGIVIDPQRDIDRMHEAASAASVTIALVLETHVHNDYVSGGLTLSRVTGAALGHADGEHLTFEHDHLHDGDRRTVGSMSVEVVHTPGHTEHHLSYVVRVEGRPPAVFTGGSLLYGTVGRTDLVDEALTDRLTRAQHRSAHRLAGMLPDDAHVYPTHGFGSFCAAAASDEDSDGTLGTERRVNLALSMDDEDSFVERLVSGLTAYPAYYVHMDPLNRAGPAPIDLSDPVAVDPVELGRRIHRGEWVVDLRGRRVFAAEHITGTIGLEHADGFVTYLGWLIPWSMPVTLLGESIEQVRAAQRQMVRIGIDRPAGQAHGNLDEIGSGLDRTAYAVAAFADLAALPADERAELTVVDVRRHDEHDVEHITGSTNMPLERVLADMHELPAGQLWVHCASGFRASIAASLLHRGGHGVTLIDDEWDAAGRAGFALDTPADDG